MNRIDSLISQKRNSMLIDFGAELSFFSDKRVIVTGGTGFIGSAIVRRFASIAKEVHVITRESSATERIETVLANIHLHCIVVDGATPLSEQLPGIKPDIIIHCAQPSCYGIKSAQDFIQVQHASSSMITNVLEYARVTKAQKIIHLGSSTVYGPNNLDSFTEDGPFGPDTMRGLTKLAERNLCLYYARTFGVPVNIARVFRAYGPYEDSNRLIVETLKKHSRGQRIDIVTDDIVRDYIHVDDIILCVARMCEVPLVPGEEFNIASGKTYNARQIVSCLQEALNAQNLISDKSYPLSNMDRTFKKSDISKAKALLGWEPQIDIKEGLQDVVTWYHSLNN